MKFSVIIPVYNKADTILAAVESVLEQTFQDFEIIIVDDGSIDSLEQILSALKHKSLRLIRQDNRGVSVARNTGIFNAKGEYICFLDADDLWKNNHLEVLYDMIVRYPQSRTFITSHEILTPEGKTLHSRKAIEKYDEDFETDDLLGLLNDTAYFVVHTNSMCIQLSLLREENIYFEPGVKIGEDTDVWYRLGLKNNVAISKKETTVYRREFSTATRKSFHIQKWMFSFREAEILADEQISNKVKKSLIQLLDRYKLTCSREYMASGDKKQARYMLSKVNNKKTIRYILTLIFSFLPCFVCRRVLRK